MAFALSVGLAHAQQFVDESAARLPSPTMLEYSEQADFADVDGDGDLDLMIGNGRSFFVPSLQEQNRLLINDGDGFFTDESASRLPPGMLGYTRDVEFGDVDADGDLDLFVANYFSTQSWLWLNDGAGVFDDATATHLPASVHSISDADFGDIDNDGDLDLILAENGVINPGSGFGTALDLLYLNDGAGHFTDASAKRLPGVATGQAIDFDFFDMDGDFDLDLINGHRFNSTRLWRNDDGFFSDVTTSNFPGGADQTYSIDPGDIDGDGDLDLLLTSGVEEAAFVNDGAGDFTEVSETAFPINSIATDDNDGDFIDLDNDGDLDFVIAFLGNGTERFYVNDGTGVLTQTPGFISMIIDATLDVEFADVDNDGRTDLFTAQGEAGTFANRLYMNTGPVDTLAPRFPALEQLPDTKDTTGPYIVRVVIRDDSISDNNFVNRSTSLRYQVNDGPAVMAELVWVGGDIYRGAIPGQAAGSDISYKASATDQAGNAGESSERSFQILGGGTGDGDGDGDVDLADVAAFQQCVTGPEVPAPSDCVEFDLDNDADIDFADLGAMQVAFTGRL